MPLLMITSLAHTRSIGPQGDLTNLVRNKTELPDDRPTDVAGLYRTLLFTQFTG